MSEMDNSWVLLELNKQQYGIRTEHIREMVLLNKPSKLPDYPDYIRGVINHRNMMIPVLDLRKRLGMISHSEEINRIKEIFEQAEQEHFNWLNELKSSVEEKREFELTCDSDGCAFGQWSKNFTTENQSLMSVLNKIKKPHELIHEVVNEIHEFIDNDDSITAKAIIQNTRNSEFAEMKALFKEVRLVLSESSREIVIVVEHNRTSVGFVVDKVQDVLDILPNDIVESPKTKGGKQSVFIEGLAKVDDDVKILLNVEALIKGFRSEKSKEQAA